MISLLEIMDPEYLENPDFDWLSSRGVSLLDELFKTNTTLQNFELTDFIDYNNLKEHITKSWNNHPRKSPRIC